MNSPGNGGRRRQESLNWSEISFQSKLRATSGAEARDPTRQLVTRLKTVPFPELPIGLGSIPADHSPSRAAVVGARPEERAASG